MLNVVLTLGLRGSEMPVSGSFSLRQSPYCLLKESFGVFLCFVEAKYLDMTFSGQ